MSSGPVTKEAKASFKYIVKDKEGTVSVGAVDPVGKTRDDWKIALAIDAGVKVARRTKADISAITLSLISFAAETNK